MNYYCVACRTGGEAKVRAHLNKFFARELEGRHEVRVFFPMRKMFERRKGKRLVSDQPILPGYLMLCTELDLSPFSLEVGRIPGSYGFLRNLDKSVCLRGADREYAAWIMGHNGVIKPSKVVYRKGSPIKVTEGPLANLHGNIVRVDHRGARVLVEFDFAGVVRRVSLPVEFIDPD
jgi:transcriptional antiterminator NusG